VRRTASFSDAVHRLSYARLHRLQSPWREAGSHRGGALTRPRSARLGNSSSMDRGQAVFMLQSPEPGGGDGEAPGAALPPRQPSPRLAACVSLPPALEREAQLASMRGVSMPASARRRSGGSGGGAQPATVPEEEEGKEEEEPVADVAVGVSSLYHAQQHAAAPAPDQAQGSHAQLAHQEPATRASAPPPAVQHASIAVADAAAAAAAGTGPVFVPMVLSIKDEEYEGMLHDWLANQQRALGGGDGATAPGEAAARLRRLQEHLRRYSATGVPVVECDPSDMGPALDAMHAYVLQCIELALT
jgi:hypothetical protein